MSDQFDLLTRFSLNWAEALAGVVRSSGGRILRKPAFVATDAGRPAGLLNSVVLLEPLDEAAVSSRLVALEAFFAFGGVSHPGTVFMFAAWPPADLTAFGWACVEQMPLMLRRPGGRALPAPGLRISEGRSIGDLHHFEQVMIEGFPAPELQGLPAESAFGSSLLEDRRFRFWLGWEDGRPVSAAATFVSHGLSHLSFLATLPEARGRGFGSALAWTSTIAEPDLPAMVIASEAGQRIYARIGYQHVCDMPLWVREQP